MHEDESPTQGTSAGGGERFLEGLGAFGPQPLQDSIPLSAKFAYEEYSLTAERPTGLLREGQGGEAGSKSLWLPLVSAPPALAGGDRSRSHKS